MAPPWVKSLKPSGPQGSELLAQERAQSNIPVEKLSKFLFTKEVLARQDKILNTLKADKVSISRKFTSMAEREGSRRLLLARNGYFN